jgi:hypothetical protein
MRAINRNACDWPFDAGCEATHRRPVVRSDGKTFELWAAESAVNFPALTQSARRPISSRGFWYDGRKKDTPTQSVVVILRNPPLRSAELMHQVEVVADKLAMRLARAKQLALMYEFDGSRLV